MRADRQGPALAATYRLQLGPGLDFAEVGRQAVYFSTLGVSHLYLSPVFQARPGSPHGYDVVDHGLVSSELGGEQGLLQLAAVLERQGLALVLDVVPNHMCIADGQNRLWLDLLENGPSSPHAAWFDVDWTPPKPDLAEKVLLPILGDQYGRVLEKGEIRVAFEAGTFLAAYHDQRFPLAPRSWPALLDPALERLRATLGNQSPHVLELESVLTAISHLPLRGETEPERVRERQREKEIVKRRLASLAEACPAFDAALAEALSALNGVPGDPRSFDRLEALLDSQAYRLSHWRVASDEINYRRFFDVNELAAIRVEREEVFEAVHALPLRLLREGHVAGLRVDHVDGLLDPAGYLARLAGPGYLVVEKVLVGDERLRADWPVDGTTGYEFLNLLNGLFVHPAGARALRQAYPALTGVVGGWRDEVYASKKLVLAASLSAELTVLARRLDRISEQHRFSRDFTLDSQRFALAEILASFPVYRTYVGTDGHMTPDDRRHVDAAVRQAIRRNPAVSVSLFEFVASVLRLDHPLGLDEAQRAERLDFVLGFQQLTGPVMAKGLEDTANYRFFPLASLNEVGGEPDRDGRTPAEFQAACVERQKAWPRALSATSTHDTKRDEDVRARLDVLSEVPEAWLEACRRWSEMNAGLRTQVDEAPAPDANAEYLIYQTLVGTWSPGRLASGLRADYVGRIKDYARKAQREAKLHTSWISPHEAWERALDEFVEGLLEPARSAPFLADLEAFWRPLLPAARLTACAQVLLKATAPGVPDFYQGTELDECRLVDPDNRQPVDFTRRAELLGRLDREPPAPPVLLERLADPDEPAWLKLWVTSRALRLRRRQAALFELGRHLPLRPVGAREEQVLAFARTHENETVLTLAGRFFTWLPSPPVGGAAWPDTQVPAPDGSYRDALTGQELHTQRGRLSVAEVFARLPLALLERKS